MNNNLFIHITLFNTFIYAKLLINKRKIKIIQKVGNEYDFFLPFNLFAAVYGRKIYH